MSASPLAVPVVGVCPEERPSPLADGLASVEPLRLAGFEFSLETAGLDALEAVARALSPVRLAELTRLVAGTEEAALLATCHRVEVLLVLSAQAPVRGWQDALPGPPTGWRLREGHETVRHLFRVAAGEESLAVGEKEVRDQVRRASHGVISRHPRPLLRPLLERAADAATRVAPVVPLARSIAAVAATRVLELVPAPFPRVLIVGTGAVGRQLAELLASCARVTVVYRHRPPDAAFLRAIGGRAVPTAEVRDELRLADAVVTAAKSGNHCLDSSDLPVARSIVLVDLGVPRNIDPAVRGIPGVTLIDLEDLRRPTRGVAGGSRQEVTRAIDGLADLAARDLERALLEPWVAAVRRGAESIRRSEFEIARRFLGTLDDDQLDAIDRLSRRLVARLLREPTERVRCLPIGPEGDRVRRLAVEMFRSAT